MCFGVVDAENYDNWHWFLRKLKGILDPNRIVVFMSDRNIGLVQAMPQVFPNAMHGYCLLHLKRNLRNRLKGKRSTTREQIVDLFSQCAYAPTIQLFDELVAALRFEGGREVDRFLSDLPYEHWANAHFPGQRYGEMYTNIAESFNSWISKLRHLPVAVLVDEIRVKLMEQFAARRADGNKWCSNGICPNVDSKLGKTFDECRTWNVSCSSVDVFEVHSQKKVSVDVRRHTCTCHLWEINGLPCRHAVCAIKKSGNDLNLYVDAYYHVQSYLKSYADFIFPVPTIWKPEETNGGDSILPPLSKKPPGRPRVNRIPSNGEKHLRKIRCGRCQKMGHHNRKSCKEALRG